MVAPFWFTVGAKSIIILVHPAQALVKSRSGRLGMQSLGMQAMAQVLQVFDIVIDFPLTSKYSVIGEPINPKP